MRTSRTALAIVVAVTAALGAQSKTAAPVVSIEGPQGIGLRAGPIPADAPRFDVASIRRDASGVMPPSGQGQLVNVQAAARSQAA